MDRVEIKNLSECPSPEISAYIDGELSASGERELELHIAGCSICADDLNLQKTFLNALESSLDDKTTIELPKNFTRAVVANAESRVSGLRRPGERRNAALICAVLILFSVFALGSNSEKALAATSSVVEQLIAVVVSVGHVVYHFALGTTIVFRSLASKFVFESGIAVMFFLVLFMLSLYLSSRLLVRFHRT
jgi:anti-sigma factor RsiW